MKTHEMHDWLKAGAHYRGKGNFEKALEAFAQARLALLCEMGECLASLGQLDEGRVLFEEVLEANSADLRANTGIGVISLLSGDAATAEIAFGNVLHRDPGNAKALCGMGMAKKANGQLEAAYSLLLQSLDKDSMQKTALQALADVGIRLNRTAEVLPLLRKYLKCHPEDVEIAQDIQMLQENAPETVNNATSGQLKDIIDSFLATPDDPRIVNELLHLLRQLGRDQDAQEVRSVYLGRNPGKESVLLQF